MDYELLEMYLQFLKLFLGIFIAVVLVGVVLQSEHLVLGGDLFGLKQKRQIKKICSLREI